MKNQIKQIEAMRNPMAAMLAHGAARPKIVRAKKGKGSFQRKSKFRARDFG